MNRKLHKIAEEKEYCCIFQLIRHTMGFGTARLANALDITERCVRARRREYRLKVLKPCDKCHSLFSG